MSAAPVPVGRPEEEGVPPAMRGLVSRSMRAGLLLAVLFAALGVAGLVARGIGLGSGRVALSLSGPFLPALAAGNPTALALVAVAILVATPLLRVVESTALFAVRGDRTFATITLVVLLLLLATVAVGALR